MVEKKKLNMGQCIDEATNELYYNTLVKILNNRQDVVDEVKQVYLEQYTKVSDVKTEKVKVLKSILDLLDISYEGFLKLANGNRETKVREISAGALMIDNYLNNVEIFYERQPFFYDKAGIFWFWTENKYEIVDSIDVMNMLDGILGFRGQTINSKLKANYLEAFKRLGRKRIPKDAPSKWIQFKDKAYSLNSGNIYDVEPNFFFTNPIPWEIGDTEDTPVMDRLFKEWVGEKYVKSLYEILAYCCYPEYPIQTLFCLYGNGRNGKSQFIKVLEKFIGAANSCSTELDLIAGNNKSRFEVVKLYKKLVCLMGETNFGMLNSTSLIKKLTGGDKIGFEMKGKDPFDAYNYAKIIIASNSLPTTEDESDGNMRRWMIIDFPNEFNDAGREVYLDIPDQEYRNLARKVFRLLKELLARGLITNQGTIEERRTRYMMASNPLPYFIDKCCKKDEYGWISYNELYVKYTHFLKMSKKRKVSRKEFKSALESEGFWVDRTAKKFGDDWKSGYYVDGLVFDNFDILQVIPTQKFIGGKEVETAAKMTKITKKDVSFIKEVEDVE